MILRSSGECCCFALFWCWFVLIIVFVYIMSCLFWGCEAGGFLFGVGGWAYVNVGGGDWWLGGCFVLL